MRINLLYRWWKGLDVPNNVPYARDRMVECYFWALGVYFEPQYSRARIFLTKVISMATILDDTYDAYGTYEELKIFTEAIQRYLLLTPSTYIARNTHIYKIVIIMDIIKVLKT